MHLACGSIGVLDCSNAQQMAMYGMVWAHSAGVRLLSITSNAVLWCFHCSLEICSPVDGAESVNMASVIWSCRAGFNIG